MTRFRRALLLPLALLLFAGCGMYGSLYLEEEPGATTPEVSEQPPIATDRDDDEDEESTAGQP
jgi:predicted small lipoprotein YifL